MIETILFFGSFNPVHKGHLALAESVLEKKLTEEIWFVLSPQNPFKREDDLWPETTRIERLSKALKGREGMYLCTAELDLPKPSYTVQTLRYLSGKYPDRRFSILMGEDNLAELHRWKEYREILSTSDIYVYPRSLRERDTSENENQDIANRVLPTKKTGKRDETEFRPKDQRTYPVQTEFPRKIHWIDSPLLDISSTLIRERIKKGLDISDWIP